MKSIPWCYAKTASITTENATYGAKKSAMTDGATREKRKTQTISTKKTKGDESHD